VDEDAYGFQPTVKKSRTSNRNPNCAVGVIQKIVLENFMCHSKLTLEPNANINFITGANGAGKSSILQALVLGLCGESKHTKRYSKISSFIQKGATKAVIEIMLNNEGEDSYKQEVYGRSIIFERTIRDNGQTAFKLKDAHGNVKEPVTKRAREEGKRALDSFKIQVENPVIVLQQDEAKEMLNTTSPEKMYQFFIQATMLKQVIDQYKAGFSDIEVLTKNMKRLEIDVRLKRKQLAEMKEVIDKATERKDEWNRLGREYAWANVKEIGDNIQDIQKEVVKKQNQLSHPRLKLDSLKSEAQSLKDIIIGNEIKNEEERSMFSVQEEELETLNQKINSIKQEEKTSRAELKTCEMAASKIMTEIRHLEDQLNNLLGKNVEELEQSERERMKQVSRLTKSIDEANKAVEVETERRLETNTEEHNLNLEVEQLDSKNKELKIKVEEVNIQINEITEMDRRLGNRSLAVYGPNYAKVEVEIQKHQNQFDRKPFGPVGFYVKLKTPAVPGSDLANLVESVLSPSLTSYLCHSDRDRRILYKIFNNVFGSEFKPRIQVSKFLPVQHKVARAEVQTTLMDLLEIREVAVFNFLVDQMNIESVAVCTTQDEAKNITTRRENVPRSLGYAITTDFYKFIPPKGSNSYKSYYIEQRSRGLLSGSTAEMLRQKHILLEQNKLKLKENEREKCQVQRQRAEVGMKKNGIIKKIQELRKNLATDNNNLQEFMIKHESDTSQNLVEMLALKKKSKNDLEGTREELKAQRVKTELQLKTVKEERDIKIREVTNLKSKWCTLDSKYSKTNVLYGNKIKEIANQEKVVKRIDVDLQNWESKRSAALVEHDKARKIALKMTDGEEIKPSESKEKLNAKLDLRKMEKENSKLSTKDFDKIMTDFSKLRKDYDSIHKKYQDQKLFLDSFKEMNISRGDMVLFIRKRVVTQVTRQFNFLTGEMAKDIGCRISLKINSNKKELRFEFKTLNGTLLKTGVASLSGGEKSYAQMALIMSLWEHMQPPFRCLDEWDVFLDQVNREKIQKAILKFGLRGASQFVLISPQDATTYSDITPKEKHKVAIIEIKKS